MTQRPFKDSLQAKEIVDLRLTFRLENSTRTLFAAIGTFGGRLKDTSSIDLGVIATNAALESAKVNPQLVDSVTFGNVVQISSPNGPYIARHVGLKAGVRTDVPCLTVNR